MACRAQCVIFRISHSQHHSGIRVCVDVVGQCGYVTQIMWGNLSSEGGHSYCPRMGQLGQQVLGLNVQGEI